MPIPRGLNEAPIPSDGRLLRCVRRAQEHQAHARVLEQLAREVGGNIEEERARLHAQSPVDLRGLPAIGRGCAGRIRGTDPPGALMGKQPR